MITDNSAGAGTNTDEATMTQPESDDAAVEEEEDELITDVWAHNLDEEL